MGIKPRHKIDQRTMEISMVMGKFGMELNCERAWTSFSQDFPITPSDKLGLTWTRKSLYNSGFTLKLPQRKHNTHCLLSGRSQVQLPPGTQKMESNSLIDCDLEFLSPFDQVSELTYLHRFWTSGLRLEIANPS